MTTVIWLVMLLQGTSIDTRAGKAVDLADRLRGITAVQLLNEAPTDGDTQCGLPEAATRLAASTVIEGGGLKVSQDRRAPVLNLDLATVFVKEFGLCVSSLRIVLSTMVVAAPQASPDYTPSPGSRIGRLEVLSRQAMLWSGAAAHGDRVRSRVAELVGQIADEIKRANP
jgi:hypothetical protein